MCVYDQVTDRQKRAKENGKPIGLPPFAATLRTYTLCQNRLINSQVSRTIFSLTYRLSLQTPNIVKILVSKVK